MSNLGHEHLNSFTERKSLLGKGKKLMSDKVPALESNIKHKGKPPSVFLTTQNKQVPIKTTEHVLSHLSTKCTVGIQLHVSALYVGHLHVVI